MPRSESRRQSLGPVVRRLRAAGCVFAEEEARLLMADAASSADLAASVERRAAGHPLEHILGWAEFCGLRIELDAGVFVPRRRTELLVNEAVVLLTNGFPRGTQYRTGPSVVDVCCGSGAVGVAVAARIPGLDLHAADIDPGAVVCARRNIAKVGGAVHEGDLYGALPPALKGKVSIITANAPYVPTTEIATLPREARNYESMMSLDGGADGLDLHRRVAVGAREWLHAGGFVLIETSVRQSACTASIMAAAGLGVRTVRADELDGTVVIGRAD